MKERLQKRFKDLQKKQKKGFTLIELIVVLVILAIILAVTVPAVTSYIEDANDAKYLANARAVFMAAEVERTKDIAASKVTTTAAWPATAAQGATDTLVSTKSTIRVANVRYEGGKYTFNLLEGTTGTTVLRNVIVESNKDIKVTKPGS